LTQRIANILAKHAHRVTPPEEIVVQCSAHRKPNDGAGNLSVRIRLARMSGLECDGRLSDDGGRRPELNSRAESGQPLPTWRMPVRGLAIDPILATVAGNMSNTDQIHLVNTCRITRTSQWEYSASRNMRRQRLSAMKSSRLQKRSEATLLEATPHESGKVGLY
jgi:hypothetical protein